MAKTIEYKRPDGKTVKGYLAEPAAGSKAPGMVVIQEWWGLNDQIRGVADKLAKAGYRALVPDLYRGKVALEANEAKHLMEGLNFGDAAGQDIRGAVQYLKGNGSAKVGDRKSTRLNSSHVEISYAVFCLKKKKKKIE